MPNQQIIRKIGNPRPSLHFFLGVAWLISISASTAMAAEVQFSAQVDRTQLAADETVNLSMIIKSQNNAKSGEIKFHAPDFEVINDFKSISVSSRYDAGTNQFS